MELGWIGIELGIGSGMERGAGKASPSTLNKSVMTNHIRAIHFWKNPVTWGSIGFLVCAVVFFVTGMQTLAWISIGTTLLLQAYNRYRARQLKREVREIIASENKLQTQEISSKIGEIVGSHYSELRGLLAVPTSLDEAAKLIGKSRVEVSDALLNTVRSAANSLQNKDYLQAEKSYHSLVVIFPDVSLFHFGLGVAYHLQQKTVEAINEYESAIRNDPDNEKASYNMGLAWHHAGNDEKALSVLEHLIEKAPDSAPVHINLGVVLASLGRLPEAESQFATAIHLDHATPTAHYNLGVACIQQGKLQEAVQPLRIALSRDRNNHRVLNNLGCVLGELGFINEALGHLKRVTEVLPDYANGHFNLGVALERAGRIEDAEKAYETAIKVDSRFGYAHLNLGIILVMRGAREGAKSKFETALQCDPELFPAYFNLARMAEEDHDDVSALDLYSKGLKYLPKNQAYLRQEISNHINELCR